MDRLKRLEIVRLRRVRRRCTPPGGPRRGTRGAARDGRVLGMVGRVRVGIHFIDGCSSVGLNGGRSWLDR